MADPIRRRRADSDVLLGTAPAAPEPPISDVPLDVIFQRVQATRDANRPADPVADDSMLSSIRHGVAAEAAANQTPAANTRRARSQEVRATEEARRETPISNMAIGHNAADALTLGFADELYGAGRGAINAATSGRDIEDEYRAARDQFRLDTERSSARYPKQASLGTVLGTAGSLAVPLPGALGRIGQGATWGRRALGAAMLGGGFGAASGLGHSDVELADDRGLSAPEYGQLAADVAVPAVAGAGLGATMSMAGDALGSGLRAFQNFRNRRELNRVLGNRAQQIIESGEIPRLTHGPGDDLDLELALSSDIGEEIAAAAQREQGVSQPIRTSIMDEASNILRENPEVMRARTAGVVGKPQLRRVAAMPGGVSGFVDVNDRLGVSQIGEVVRGAETARRAEAIHGIARNQRNSVLSAADDAGVRVSGEDIADAIRERAFQLRRIPSPRARELMSAMENAAESFEGRILPDGTRVPDDVAVLPPQYTQRQLDDIAQHYGDLGRFQSASDLPPTDVATARDIRRSIVGVRDSALEAWNPTEAQRFRDAQRALQNTMQVVPREGQISEAELRGANRAIGMTDMQAAIAGATTGASVGGSLGSVAGPVGSAAGAGLGGLAGAGIGAGGNRIFRDYEPSLFAVLGEGPAIQQRMRDLGISSSDLTPSGLAYMAQQIQQRGPRAAGMLMGDRDSDVTTTAQAQDATAAPVGAQVVDINNPDVREALGLPVDAQQGVSPGTNSPAAAPADNGDSVMPQITDPDVRESLGLPPLQ